MTTLFNLIFLLCVFNFVKIVKLNSFDRLCGLLFRYHHRYFIFIFGLLFFPVAFTFHFKTKKIKMSTFSMQKLFKDLYSEEFFHAGLFVEFSTRKYRNFLNKVKMYHSKCIENRKIN